LAFLCHPRLSRWWFWLEFEAIFWSFLLLDFNISMCCLLILTIDALISTLDALLLVFQHCGVICIDFNINDALISTLGALLLVFQHWMH
jgi:hypothetical protein